MIHNEVGSEGGAFISYRHVDKMEVDVFADALRAAGVPVWIDRTEVQDFESITHRIQHGLSTSKVLIAWYSRRYQESRACLWELSSAYTAAHRTGEDPRRRILVMNPEENVSHIEPIELRDAKVHSVHPNEAALFASVLVPQVVAHIHAIESTFGDGVALRPPRWYGVRGIGSSRFVGRTSDIWRVHSLLWQGQYTVVTSVARPPVVQIAGLGGIGKSLLAEEYALRLAGAYPGGIFGLSASGNETDSRGAAGDEHEIRRGAQMRRIATELGLATEGLVAE